jgi:hypothetical protein
VLTVGLVVCRQEDDELLVGVVLADAFQDVRGTLPPHLGVLSILSLGLLVEPAAAAAAAAATT